MAVVTSPLFIFPAVAALLALTQTAECGFNPQNRLASNQAGAIHRPAKADISRGAEGSQILLRTESEDNEAQRQEAEPLTCLQIQAIDEVELIDEPTPRADCD